MKVRKLNFGYIFRFEKGDELMSILEKFIADNQAHFASFTLVGATTNVELGFFSLKEKEYHWRNFTGEYEIVGSVGNIALHEEKPMIHLHITIADDEYRAYGGHVRKLIVGATCELTLSTSQERIERKFDEETGLNLLEV